MTIAFRKGRYGVRVATSADDLAACQALRHRCFFGRAGKDEDAFDAKCTHVMIAGDTGLVGTFRVMILPHGRNIEKTYAASSYDLARLRSFPDPMLEVGRFCIDQDASDADVLRLAWGALAQLVDTEEVAFMFGCSSFNGVVAAPYQSAFDLLGARYAAPQRWAPMVRSADVISFGKGGGVHSGHALPPLLRTYLAMGGWVSDHAVIDRKMQTIHVFTGLEIARIPAARARALRALAG